MIIRALKMGLSNIKDAIETHDFAYGFKTSIKSIFGGIKKLIGSLFLVAILPILLPIGLILQTFYSYQDLKSRKK
jgi:hypothetical protein